MSFHELSRSSFDLRHGPLARAQLQQLAAEVFRLVWVVHHIAFDRSSFAIWRNELCELYGSLGSSRAPRLRALPIRYSDYSAWQRRHLSGERLERRLTFWRDHLGAEMEPLELPSDFARPALQTFGGDGPSQRLPAVLTERLRALSTRHQASLFMTMLAGFKILLCRLSGQSQVIVGVQVPGRDHVELEPLIGRFANVFPVRTTLGDNPSFERLLAGVRTAFLQTYEQHRDLPFEKIVEHLQIERDANRSPVFQVTMKFFNDAVLPSSPGELPLYPVKIDEDTSLYDLRCYVRDHGDSVDLRISYNTNLFARERVEEMLRQYRVLLEQVVENPETRFGDFSLRTSASERLLPNPATVIAEPLFKPVHEMIAEQASRSPTHPAVIDEHRNVWAYSDLDQRATRVAASLLSRGLSRGEVVGIAGARGFELIAAVVGVMRAGGVFVLVDLDLPLERQIEIVRQSKASRLIDVSSTEQSVNGLPVEVLGIEERDTQLANREFPKVDGDDPAYIFFTSGSTGKPKGVLSRLKGLSHFVIWQGQTFE